jgi:hypothetical protein
MGAASAGQHMPHGALVTDDFLVTATTAVADMTGFITAGLGRAVELSKSERARAKHHKGYTTHDRTSGTIELRRDNYHLQFLQKVPFTSRY